MSSADRAIGTTSRSTSASGISATSPRVYTTVVATIVLVAVVGLVVTCSLLSTMTTTTLRRSVIRSINALIDWLVVLLFVGLRGCTLRVLMGGSSQYLYNHKETDEKIFEVGIEIIS